MKFGLRPPPIYVCIALNYLIWRGCFCCCFFFSVWKLEGSVDAYLRGGTEWAGGERTTTISRLESKIVCITLSRAHYFRLHPMFFKCNSIENLTQMEVGRASLSFSEGFVNSAGSIYNDRFHCYGLHCRFHPISIYIYIYYIYQSVAESYDNETVAVFALIFTFFLCIKVRYR